MNMIAIDSYQAEQPLTRAQSFEIQLQKYREETLSDLFGTKPRLITLAIAGALALLSLLLLPLHWAALSSLFIAVPTAYVLMGIGYNDRDVLARASLTPTFDKDRLEAEISTLTAAITYLKATARGRADPHAMIHAVTRCFDALHPLLARGHLTLETATPDTIARPYLKAGDSSIAGDPELLFHIRKAQRPLEWIYKAAEQDMVYGETIAHLAGNMIPHLRAIEGLFPKQS